LGRTSRATCVYILLIAPKGIEIPNSECFLIIPSLLLIAPKGIEIKNIVQSENADTSF